VERDRDRGAWQSAAALEGQSERERREGGRGRETPAVSGGGT
jgi:hypothetical protein